MEDIMRNSNLYQIETLQAKNRENKEKLRLKEAMATCFLNKKT